jgi:hypothetical protein
MPSSSFPTVVASLFGSSSVSDSEITFGKLLASSCRRIFMHQLVFLSHPALWWLASPMFHMSSLVAYMREHSE